MFTVLSCLFDAGAQRPCAYQSRIFAGILVDDAAVACVEGEDVLLTLNNGQRDVDVRRFCSFREARCVVFKCLCSTGVHIQPWIAVEICVQRVRQRCRRIHCAAQNSRDHALQQRCGDECICAQRLS